MIDNFWAKETLAHEPENVFDSKNFALTVFAKLTLFVDWIVLPYEHGPPNLIFHSSALTYLVENNKKSIKYNSEKLDVAQLNQIRYHVSQFFI